MRLNELKNLTDYYLNQRSPDEVKKESVILTGRMTALIDYINNLNRFPTDRIVSPTECAGVLHLIDPRWFMENDAETISGQLCTKLFNKLQEELNQITSPGTELASHFFATAQPESKSPTSSSSSVEILRQISPQPSIQNYFSAAPSHLKKAGICLTLSSTLISGGVALAMEAANEAPRYALAGCLGFGGGLLGGAFLSYLLFFRFPPNRHIRTETVIAEVKTNDEDSKKSAKITIAQPLLSSAQQSYGMR